MYGGMARVQWVLLPALLLAVCSAGSSSMIVCPVNSLQFVSFNRTLLPIESVKASSQDANANPTELFVEKHSQPWCSEVNQGSNPHLHINLTFSEPVVLTFLQSNGFFNAFVEQFSIEYALGAEAEELTPYGVLQPQQNFTIKHNGYLLEAAYFTLEQPLVAQRLKLNIHRSVQEGSNRSCWSLKVLGCTFRQAVDIVDEEEEFGTVNFTFPAPCTATSFSHTPHTPSPGATDLTVPLVPCPNSDRSTAEVLTLVLPVALFSIVACAVMVGIGVLSCYIIVSRKMHQGQSKYDPGYERVKVKMLGRSLPAPNDESDGGQRHSVRNKRKDSVCSNGSSSSNFHYDMPRPITYDVPRTSSQQHQTGGSSSNEYKNPLYEDGFIGKESNTYESIPEGLNRVDPRVRTLSDVLPRRERVRHPSDALPLPEKKARTSSVGPGSGRKERPANVRGGVEVRVPSAVGSVAVDRAGQAQGETPGTAVPPDEPYKYTQVDKSKKNKEGNVPVFEMLYEPSSLEEDQTKLSKLATT